MIRNISLLSLARFVSASCPACWEDNGSGCQPQQDKINIHCHSTHMEVTVNECLFKPDEQTVFLKDSSCGIGNSIEYDSDAGVYRIDADLNACGTTQSMGNDAITFYNQVSATSDDDANAIISFGTTTTIDLSCSYRV